MEYWYSVEYCGILTINKPGCVRDIFTARPLITIISHYPGLSTQIQLSTGDESSLKSKHFFNWANINFQKPHTKDGQFRLRSRSQALTRLQSSCQKSRSKVKRFKQESVRKQASRQASKQANGRTEGRTDRRYQTYYLPSFGPDNNRQVIARLAGFVGAALCTTATIQSYIVHHRTALCSTNRCDVHHCADKGPNFFVMTSSLPVRFPAWLSPAHMYVIP